MNSITLCAEGISDVTIVPNTFIDFYMPSANGAYVKVYLYLLRSIGTANLEITVTSIADHLENTETDIIRALNYWEKQKLLKIERNALDEIIAIRMVDPNLVNNINKTTVSNTTVNTTVIDNVDSEIADVSVNIHTAKEPAIRQKYTQKQISELSSNDEIKYAMHIVEIYLDRPLKPMDMQLILYLYEELNFSSELIMYLYEYCVSKNKKNPSYIEAVALSWAKEGIDTEEKAREATASHNEHLIL